MSKNKNQRIYSKDIDYLRMLAEENETYIGRPYKLDVKNGCLTIFALPPQKQKKKREDSREPRNKRAESAARRA